MTGAEERDHNDWLLPAVLVLVSVLLITVVVGVVYALRSTTGEDDSLAGEMEIWTRCLRSEGAGVPLVESLDGGGFRLTFDDAVLDGEHNPDEFLVAFDQCLDDAPESVQKVATIVDGLSSLAGGGDELGALLFSLLESEGLLEIDS